MKLNIAFPATGAQKLIEFDDEKKLRIFYDKRMSQEVDASPLGEEWKGYVFRITGGNDKQGFPMKQGVLTNGRVRLLMGAGHSCYRPRRTGERKRKSVRGCIVDANLSVLSLVVIKKGDGEIPGLTDRTVPRRLGPKRASKIRRLFNLTKQDDVRQYVLRRPIATKEGKKEGKKPKTKAPKIQRLITPLVLQRKRHRLAVKRRRAVKRREDSAAYHKLLTQLMKEKQAEKIARRRSSASRSHSQSESHSKSESAPPPAKLAAKATAAAPMKPVAGKAPQQQPMGKGVSAAAAPPMKGKPAGAAPPKSGGASAAAPPKAAAPSQQAKAPTGAAPKTGAQQKQPPVQKKK